ncbi:MAG: sigma-70 family RNA polymerase sigma factor [Phycisphaeraceae bacterium]|nr:sigma-70 family RNA polymerase sigma factor [Phycisphaeraceae bacterium]
MTDGQPEQPFHDDPEINALVIEILDSLLTVVKEMMKGSALHQFVSPEDIAHDVVIQCRPALTKFEKQTNDLKGDLRKLINAIARNTVRERARRFKTRLPAIEDAVLDQAKRDGHTPSRILGKEQTLDAVRECLSALDDKARHIVLRHLVYDETLPAIADALGMTKGQVDGLYRRALKRMRELLGSKNSHQFASSHG